MSPNNHEYGDVNVNGDDDIDDLESYYTEPENTLRNSSSSSGSLYASAKPVGQSSVNKDDPKMTKQLRFALSVRFRDEIEKQSEGHFDADRYTYFTLNCRRLSN